jgi:hypothetical protein
MPHRPVPAARSGWRGGLVVRSADPWHAVLAASGRFAGTGHAGTVRLPALAGLARLRRAWKG